MAGFGRCKKVYAALTKLKEINPLYASIDLPSSASGLELKKKLSTCVVTDPAVDDNESNGHAEDHDLISYLIENLWFGEY